MYDGARDPVDTVTTQRETDWSSLMLASRDGNAQLVTTLINTGAEVNAANCEGWSSLMVASVNVGHVGTY